MNNIVETLDGQVVFEMVPWGNLRHHILAKEYPQAIPELYETGADGELYFKIADTAFVLREFIKYFGHTRSIRFNITNDPDGAIAMFKDWYQKAAESANYRAIFIDYTAVITDKTLLAWQKAYEDTRTPEIPAPVELQPGADEVAKTDKSFQNDAGNEPAALGKTSAQGRKNKSSTKSA